MSGEPRHVLLIRLSSVGDVVLAMPAARWLRRRHPQARLTWLVDRGFEDLLENNPELDRVAVFDFTGRHSGPAGIRRLAEELRPVDLAVDLQHKLRTQLLLSRLKPTDRRVLVKRRGLDVVRAILGRDTILQAPHQARRNLALLDPQARFDDAELAALRPALRPDPQRLAAVKMRLAERLGGRRPVGLVCGARHATKVWPLAHQRALIARCVDAGLGIVLLGGQEDVARAEALAPASGQTAVAVENGGDLAELAACLAACDAVISPDSGPAHMAAALGVACVVLFGPTSPERWGPLGARVEVLRLPLACSPCSNHGTATCPLGTLECMQQLQPAEVFSALQRMLAGQEEA